MHWDALCRADEHDREADREVGSPEPRMFSHHVSIPTGTALPRHPRRMSVSRLAQSCLYLADLSPTRNAPLDNWFSGNRSRAGDATTVSGVPLVFDLTCFGIAVGVWLVTDVDLLDAMFVLWAGLLALRFALLMRDRRRRLAAGAAKPPAVTGGA